MVVAENRLSTDLIVEGLAQHAADIPANMLYYQDARGIIQLRETIAHVLQRTFMKVGISSCHSMQSKWYNAGNAGLDASLAVFSAPPANSRWKNTCWRENYHQCSMHRAEA